MSLRPIPAPPPRKRKRTDNNATGVPRRAKKAKAQHIQWQDIPSWGPSTTCPLFALPDEILDCIVHPAQGLEMRDYVSLAGTCRKFAQRMTDQIWAALLTRYSPTNAWRAIEENGRLVVTRTRYPVRASERVRSQIPTALDIDPTILLAHIFSRYEMPPLEERLEEERIRLALSQCPRKALLRSHSALFPPQHFIRPIYWHSSNEPPGVQPSTSPGSVFSVWRAAVVQTVMWTPIVESYAATKYKISRSLLASLPRYGYLNGSRRASSCFEASILPLCYKVFGGPIGYNIHLRKLAAAVAKRKATKANRKLNPPTGTAMELRSRTRKSVVVEEGLTTA